MSHSNPAEIVSPLSLINFFSVVEDPRIERSKRYPLVNIKKIGDLFIKGD